MKKHREYATVTAVLNIAMVPMFVVAEVRL